MLKQVVFVVIAGISSAARAGAPDGGAAAPSPPRPDTAQLRAQVQALAEALGVKQAAPPEEKQRTAVDVADRALDMFGSAVASVASQIEQHAPLLWKVMVKQQYAKAVADVIPSLGWILVALLAHFVVRRKWQKPSDNTEEGLQFLWHFVTWVVPLALGIIGVSSFVVSASDSVKFVINPEYYAVRDILLMVMNPSGMR